MENQNREELYSCKVFAGRRTYYFNVKQTHRGDIFLLIHEVSPDGGVIKHNRVVVYEDHLADFQEGIAKAAEFISDAVAGREKLETK